MAWSPISDIHDQEPAHFDRHLGLFAAHYPAVGGGIAPNCCIMLATSNSPQYSATLPSSKRHWSKKTTVISLPVGARP